MTRKLKESIKIGDDIKITLLDIKEKYIRIGIEAPRDVAVHRDEVYQLIKEQNIEAFRKEAIQINVLTMPPSPELS